MHGHWLESAKLPGYRLPTAAFVALAAVVVAVGVGARWITVVQATDVPMFQWQGRPLLSSNDGYYFLRLARDWIGGSLGPRGLPDNGHLALVAGVTALAIPVHVETVAYYLPVVIGPLLAIPLMLIGRRLGNDIVGLAAGLAGPLAAGYFERTTAGYFDTDMVAVTLPLMTAWSLMATGSPANDRSLLLPPLLVIAAQWLYPPASILNLAIAGTYLAWVLLFEHRSDRHYRQLTLLLVPFTGLGLSASALAVFAMYFALTRVARSPRVTMAGLLVVSVWAAVIQSKERLPRLWSFYVERGEADISVIDAPSFLAHAATVDEAQVLSIGDFAAFAGGHWLVAVFALGGYGLLAWRRPAVLPTLPFLLVGVIGLSAGERFAIYLAPILALGIACLVALSWSWSPRAAGRAIAMIVLVATAIPNLSSAVTFSNAAAIFHDEVAALDRLRASVKPGDYVICWWDYGYAAEYFSRARTLVDGGRFQSGTLALTAHVLARGDEPVAANRIARHLVAHDAALEHWLTHAVGDPAAPPEGVDAKKVLEDSKSGFMAPSLESNIYLYLPYRMIHHYPVIDRFASALDARRQPLRYDVGEVARTEDGRMLLGSRAVADPATGIVARGAETLRLGAWYLTGLDPDGDFAVRRRDYERPGPVLIVMSEYPTHLLVDETTTTSTFVRLFALEDYDPAHYRPVALTSLAKVYRLFTATADAPTIAPANP